MNVQEAKIVAAQLTAKVNAGAVLTEEEQAQSAAATAVMIAAAEANKPGSTEHIRAQVDAQLNDRTPAGKAKYLGLTMSPGLKLVASALTYVGVAALGALAGVKFEQRRSTKRNALTQSNDASQSSTTAEPAPLLETHPVNVPVITTGRGRTPVVH